jgi:UDP-N-acetylmuramate dehydrogenase
MKIYRDEEVSKLITLGVAGCVDFLGVARTEVDIIELCQWAKEKKLPVFVLAGGSNVVFGRRYNGLVIKIETRGIDVEFYDGEHVEVKVSAGEDLDGFIQYTIDNGFWGLENLSWIPGTVGATPVQNVGAYGQDVGRVISGVRCYDTSTGNIRRFDKSECKFSHRSSIFNKNGGERYIILQVYFKLSCVPDPILTREQLRPLKVLKLEPRDLHHTIRKTVIEYRTNGINLPAGIGQGSAGTFFQTAVISGRFNYYGFLFRSLLSLGPRVALLLYLFALKYRIKGGYRVPSRLLIKSCGLQNLREGSVYLLPSNPSVVVVDVDDKPSFVELETVIHKVIVEVFKKTGLKLPIEPKLIKFDLPKNIE